PLLLEELSLVAKPGAGIFAVGNAVAQHLERCAFPKPFTQVIHYSGQAAQARALGIAGHEDSFEAFRRSVSLQRVLARAGQVLIASAVAASIRDEARAQLAKSQLSESRLQLIFNYKLAFDRTLHLNRLSVIDRSGCAASHGLACSVQFQLDAGAEG